MKRLVGDVNLLKQILDAVASGITVQDPDGKLVYVNPAATRFLNCDTPEEALALGSEAIVKQFHFFDENGRPLSVKDLPGRRALKGEVEAAKIIGSTSAKTRGTLWSSVKALPVKDASGQVILAVNVFEDITASKESEAKLRDANQRITDLLAKTLKVSR